MQRYMYMNGAQILQDHKSAVEHLAISPEERVAIGSQDRLQLLGSPRDLNRSVVIINFDYSAEDTDPLSTERYSVLDLKSALLDERLRDNSSEGKHLCNVASQADEEELVGIGFFPTTIGRPEKAWPVVETIRGPFFQVKDGDEDDQDIQDILDNLEIEEKYEKYVMEFYSKEQIKKRILRHARLKMVYGTDQDRESIRRDLYSRSNWS